MQLFSVLFVLLASGAAGEVHRFPPVIIDKTENSVCPPDNILEAARSNITENLLDILTKIAATITNNYTISACGGAGWKRVVYIDMTDPAHVCPEPWRLYPQGTARACGRQTVSDASCDAVQFSVDGNTYSQVCGRITGYQYGSPDASHWRDGADYEIDEPYLDGVSITHSRPRQHIWSFFGAHYDGFCCSEQHLSNVELLDFLGNNSFCDTGNPVSGRIGWEHQLNLDYPLWDGDIQCANDPNCCAPHRGPWFHATLSSPSASDIEVRICGDQTTGDEDTPIGLIEIFIK